MNTRGRIDDKYYVIAMECAKRNAEGCNMQCQICQFNIFNYLDDVREAALLKATAQTDYERNRELSKKIEQDKAASFWGPMLFSCLLIGLLVWGCQSCLL